MRDTIFSAYFLEESFKYRGSGIDISRALFFNVIFFWTFIKMTRRFRFAGSFLAQRFLRIQWKPITPLRWLQKNWRNEVVEARSWMFCTSEFLHWWFLLNKESLKPLLCYMSWWIIQWVWNLQFGICCSYWILSNFWLVDKYANTL